MHYFESIGDFIFNVARLDLIIFFASHKDSCDVYGELNFYDNNTMNEILECQATVGESATLADIPDEGLREEVRAKIVEIVLNYYDSDVGNAETIASGFDSLPFASVQQFIVNANTPEHMEKYADALLNGVDPGFLDLEVLALGRPAASLEYVIHGFISHLLFRLILSRILNSSFVDLYPREVSTQCDLIQAMNPSAEMLNQTFTLDPDAFSLKVRNSLNASYSSLLQLYKCGDINAFVESGEVNSDPELSLLLNGRNEQMAAKVDDVLMESDPNKKVLFAVGLAHWLLGSNNMISLLEGYGYSMERIPNWNATQLENPSNEYCGVHWNPEAGIFVADSSIGTATPDAPSEGDASTTPLTKPSQEAEKEVTPVLASSASYTVKGIVSVIIVWGSYMLY